MSYPIEQFVYHNLVNRRNRNLANDVELILRDGLWTPVDYSNISTDIFFWGGGKGEFCLIIDTPHLVSRECGVRNTHWQRIRLMEPVGEIYLPGDPSIPQYVHELYSSEEVSTEKSAKGFRRIPPENIKAIVQWEVGSARFHSQ